MTEEKSIVEIFKEELSDRLLSDDRLGRLGLKRRKLKPCPAGKSDAQLPSGREFVFCSKYKAKNPNYQRITKITAIRSEKEHKVDLETGTIKW